jgi:hypothetical protein
MVCIMHYALYMSFKQGRRWFRQNPMYYYIYALLCHALWQFQLYSYCRLLFHSVALHCSYSVCHSHFYNIISSIFHVIFNVKMVGMDIHTGGRWIFFCRENLNDIGIMISKMLLHTAKRFISLILWNKHNPEIGNNKINLPKDKFTR